MISSYIRSKFPATDALFFVAQTRNIWRKYSQLTFFSADFAHIFFDSALRKTGRGISPSFRAIFRLREISKDIWLHQKQPH